MIKLGTVSGETKSPKIATPEPGSSSLFLPV